MAEKLYIGTAGWTIPIANAAAFEPAGSHLERYSRVFSCCEINSSFHREHRFQTWSKWAAAAPEHFRFAVKMPRTITHEGRLARGTRPQFEAFLEQTAALGDKRGPVLLQTPPKLDFDRRSARSFFTMLRKLYGGPAALEPRHATWFDDSAEALLREFRIARVGADPALSAEAASPGGWPGLVYIRLHGSPRRYYSSYSQGYLQTLASDLRKRSEGAETWCIFDNTASGAAMSNLLQLQQPIA